MNQRSMFLILVIITLAIWHSTALGVPTDGLDVPVALFGTQGEAVPYLTSSSMEDSIGTECHNIRVITPDGGQSWKQGTRHTITWRYNETAGSAVKIVLVKGGVAHRVIAKNVPIGTGGVGSYSWKVPFNQVIGMDYLIRVISINNTSYRDASNSSFNITAGIPLTVAVPNGGETWKPGTSQVIRWKYTGESSSSVKIYLLKGGKVDQVIEKDTPIGSGGVGSYQWFIPPSQSPGSDYKVRIVSTSDMMKKDVSNNAFTLTSGH